ncbi:hypothetical protein GOP47_0021472 [Adiantum capillus-veneris]|uniref:Uncharacterized protein n=1 Tax=Adiantum capillus-veneris TaxID=13818 RepID=A0A9D4U870_ADICA|nr:hypothetical protein GOP47_0021472 [Adiantum capillus-veneris]
MDASIFASVKSLDMEALNVEVDALLKSLDGLHIDNSIKQADSLLAPAHEQLMQAPRYASNPATQEGSAAEAAARVDDQAPWVESLLQEMQRSPSVDDARQRVASALQAFQQHVQLQFAHSSESWKAQAQHQADQNQLLKRAVLIQHKRHLQRDYAMQQMKEVTVLLHEQVRDLETKNYKLNMHLKKSLRHADDQLSLLHPPPRDAF